MPISDEVIELAPVKKTKKTLIIMIAGMGAMLALAVTFLILYLLKPSVTEEKNNIKNVGVTATELFSTVENGEEVLYASIGNEYIVYATITAENGASTNVQWDWPRDLIEVKEENSGEGAYLKFIPRSGAHGKTAVIKARAASKVEESQSVTFKIVNQGAEDIQVTSYGVRDNMTTVSGDNLDKVLEITVPYYTMNQSANNKAVIVNFSQRGKYNATANEYSKLTSIETDKGKTDAVSVESSDTDVVAISSGSVDTGRFTFTAKKHGNAEIRIKANINNDTDCKVITKVIKVNVELNTTLGYVDSMYFFNKPIVDVPFIKSMLINGNAASVDSAKIRKLLNDDKSIALASNDKLAPGSNDFALVLPYSRVYTYNDIFRHVLLNPANIQYGGDAFKENWYKDIHVTSSDDSILKVTTDSKTGEVKLLPNNISGTVGGETKCYLTFTDAKPNSAGASLRVPVRIVAQNESAAISVEVDGNPLEEPSDIKAVTGGKYTVKVTYNLGVPGSVEKPETLLESKCINNAYTLNFKADELTIRLKGGTKDLAPNTAYSADAFEFVKQNGGTAALTQYKATITFEVQVKKTSDGKALFEFIKHGTELYGSDERGLEDLEKSWTMSAGFSITERATKAWIAKDSETDKPCLDLVTVNNKFAGRFERESETRANIYVQYRDRSTPLALSQANVLKNLVRANAAHFNITKYNISNLKRVLEYVNSNNHEEGLVFGSATNFGEIGATITFDVTDAGSTNIATLVFNIYVIDAVDKVVPKQTADTVFYDASPTATLTFGINDVQVQRVANTASAVFAFTDINIYYGGTSLLQKDPPKNGSLIFRHEDQPLYSYDVKNKKLSLLTDIYAYSYTKGIDFSRINIEFLLNDSDEYVGKHYGRQFNYDKTMSCEFKRYADNVALFKSKDCSADDEIKFDDTEKKFTSNINQDKTSAIFASSVVTVNGRPVYVERKTESNAHIASVERAYINKPSNFAYISAEEVSGRTDCFYNLEYKAPTIGSAESRQYPFTVYSEKTTVPFVLTVENAVRGIKTIGIYSDQECNTPIKNVLSFGGFINAEVKYSNTIYLKVEYNNAESRHTQFDRVLLRLPSYLVKNSDEPQTGDRNDYYFQSDDENVKTLDSDIFPCTIELVTNSGAQSGEIMAIAENNIGDEGKAAKCAVSVSTGLRSIFVKKAGSAATDATLTTSQAGNVYHTFALANAGDIQTLSFGLTYGVIAKPEYNIEFDNVSSNFVVGLPAAENGLEIVNNLKNDSTFDIKIANGISTFENLKLTFTFTDTFNGTDKTNVFTLNIYITVTMDIFDLKFNDGLDTTVTVSGKSTGEQTLPIGVSYNSGSVQPTQSIVNAAEVVGVYVKDGAKYKKYVGDDIYSEKRIVDSAAVYTLHVKNSIDRSTQYYLGLAYDNVTFVADKHIIPITVNTETCHIEFDDNNVELKQSGTDLVADVVVDADSTQFRLAVNVVNDSTDAVVVGKTVTYELFANEACTESTTGDVSISDGIITVTPNKTSNTVYYRASYTDTNNGITYYKNAVFKYRVAPSAVSVENVDSNVFDSTNKTLVLYFGGANNYTRAELGNKIKTVNSFGVAYASNDNVETTVALKTAGDGAYLRVNGYTLTPIKLNNNTETRVVVTVSAKYAGETVTEDYTVIIRPVEYVTFVDTEGTLSLVDKTSGVTVTPVINGYNGFTYKYTLTADVNGIFDIGGDAEQKTVKLLSNTVAEKGKAYTLTARLAYTYVDSDAVISVGAFVGTAKYTVSIVGEYTPNFRLVGNNGGVLENVPEYDALSGETVYVIDPNAQYRIEITADDGAFNAAYTATATQTVIKSIGEFASKQADIALNANASGAFDITVNARVGGTTYSHTQHYYFTYGQNATAKLYISENNSAFTEFSADTQNIDFEDAPYRFKYEISDIPTEVVTAGAASIVVNGDVSVGEMQKDTAGNTLYVIITATKPTTVLIGGSVVLGSRTVYLPEKKVRLLSVEPDFEVTVTKASILPSETATLGVTAAAGFAGLYTVKYTVDEGCKTLATVTDDGVLTASSNITATQTVIVHTAVTVSNGVYKGTYNIDKSVTVIGVALPVVRWNANVLRTVAAGEYNYSSNDYTVDNNNDAAVYNYTGKISYTMTAQSTCLTSSDYTFVNGKLTVKSDGTRAGGSIVLKITATVTRGAHSGESVSDTVTVRVLPQMNSETAQITLPNSAGSYDLNGVAYKGIFAPCYRSDGDEFVHAADAYGVVEIEIESVNSGNASDFGIDGSKIVLKKPVTDAAVSLTLRVTTLISDGAYAGTSVVGTKTVVFTVPNNRSESIVWNNTSNSYNSVTLNKNNTVGSAFVGSVVGIRVQAVGDLSDRIFVTDNGAASPTINVDKACNAYFDAADAKTVGIELEYVVTLDNGNAYYMTATYTVDPFIVVITGEVGNTEVEQEPILVNAGETFVIDLTASGGFAVAVDKTVTVKNSGSPSSLLTATVGGSGVQFVASEVTARTDLDITLKLYVAGMETTYAFKAAILPPETGELYTAETEYTDFAKGANGTVSSKWNSTPTNTRYLYAYSVTLTAPNNGSLSTYFTSLRIDSNTAISGSALNASSVQLFFNSNHNHSSQKSTFALNMTVNTANALPLSAVEAKLVVYSRDYGGYYTTVTMQYRLRVIDGVTVTLDVNADNDSVECDPTVSVKYKGVYNNLPTPTRTGHVFTGWYDYATAVSDEAPKNYVGKTVTDPDPHTLYAHWTPKIYNVKYNNNYTGGDAISETKQVTYGETFGALYTPTRKGYDFAGWTDSATDGNIVTANTVVMPADNATEITLYAQWRVVYYNITLNANGGEQSITVQAAYGSWFELHLAYVPTYDGKVFDGWYKQADGNEKVTTAIPVSGKTELFAHWKSVYTVKFDLNAEDVQQTFADKAYTEGDTYGELPVAAPRATHDFAGWTVVKNGTDVVKSTDVVSPTDGATVTLYAKWTPLDEYTVEFDVNGGGMAAPSAITVYNTRKYGELPTILRERYSFDGWFTLAEGGVQITSESTVSLSADQTLYAHWTQVECTVTLNAAGGKIGGNNTLTVTVAVGGKYSLYNNITPEYDGYTFNGWKYQGTVLNGEELTIDRDITIYADWTANTYTTTFNIGDDADATIGEEWKNPKEYTFGTQYGALPTPTRTDYNFNGWYTEENGGGSLITERSHVGANNITLYAYWTPVSE